jgi:DNA-binding MarR family transcriptional regulator
MSYPRVVPVTTVRTDSGLSSQLRISIMRLARRLRAERPDDSLTLNQLSAMSTLANHGRMPLGELAAYEKVQPPSMTRTVACLEEGGLVQRVPHPTDRRQVLVELTEEGHARVAEDRKRRDAWLARRLRELSKDERDALRAAAPVLQKLAVW